MSKNRKNNASTCLNADVTILSEQTSANQVTAHVMVTSEIEAASTLQRHVQAVIHYGKPILLMVALAALITLLSYYLLPTFGIAGAVAYRLKRMERDQITSSNQVSNDLIVMEHEISSIQLSATSTWQSPPLTLASNPLQRLPASQFATALTQIHEQYLSSPFRDIDDLHTHKVFVIVDRAFEQMKMSTSLLQTQQTDQSIDITVMQRRILAIEDFFKNSYRYMPTLAHIVEMVTNAHQSMSAEQYVESKELLDYIINNFEKVDIMRCDFCSDADEKQFITSLNSVYERYIQTLKENRNFIAYFLKNPKHSHMFELLFNQNENICQVLMQHFSRKELYDFFTGDVFSQKIAYDVFLRKFISTLEHIDENENFMAFFDFFEWYYNTKIEKNSFIAHFIPLQMTSIKKYLEMKQQFESIFFNSINAWPPIESERDNILHRVITRAMVQHESCQHNLYYKGMLLAPQLWRDLIDPLQGKSPTPELVFALIVNNDYRYLSINSATHGDGNFLTSLAVHDLRMKLFDYLNITESTTFNTHGITFTYRELFEYFARHYNMHNFENAAFSSLHYWSHYRDQIDFERYETIVAAALAGTNFAACKHPNVNIEAGVKARVANHIQHLLYGTLALYSMSFAGMALAVKMLHIVYQYLHKLRQTAPMNPLATPTLRRAKKISRHGNNGAAISASSSLSSVGSLAVSGHAASANDPSTSSAMPLSLLPISAAQTSSQFAHSGILAESTTDRYDALCSWQHRQQQRAGRLLEQLSGLQQQLPWEVIQIKAYQKALQKVIQQKAPQKTKQLDISYLVTLEFAFEQHKQTMDGVNLYLTQQQRVATALAIAADDATDTNQASTSSNQLIDETPPASPPQMLPPSVAATSSSTVALPSLFANGQWTKLSTKAIEISFGNSKRTRPKSSLPPKASSKSVQQLCENTHGDIWRYIVSHDVPSAINTQAPHEELMQQRLVLFGWALEKILALLDEDSIMSPTVDQSLRGTAICLRNILVHQYDNITNAMLNELRKNLNKSSLKSLSLVLPQSLLYKQFSTLYPTSQQSVSPTSFSTTLPSSRLSTETVTTMAPGRAMAILIYFLGRLNEIHKSIHTQNHRDFPIAFRAHLVIIRELWRDGKCLVQTLPASDKVFVEAYFHAFTQAANQGAHAFSTARHVEAFFDLVPELAIVITHVERALTLQAQQRAPSTSSTTQPRLTMKPDASDFVPPTIVTFTSEPAASLWQSAPSTSTETHTATTHLQP